MHSVKALWSDEKQPRQKGLGKESPPTHQQKQCSINGSWCCPARPASMFPRGFRPKQYVGCRTVLFSRAASQLPEAREANIPYKAASIKIVPRGLKYVNMTYFRLFVAPGVGCMGAGRADTPGSHYGRAGWRLEVSSPSGQHSTTPGFAEKNPVTTLRPQNSILVHVFMGYGMMWYRAPGWWFMWSCSGEVKVPFLGVFFA